MNCLVYGIRSSLIERIKAARNKTTADIERAQLIQHKPEILEGESGIFDDNALPLSINTNIDIPSDYVYARNSYERFSDSPFAKRDI